MSGTETVSRPDAREFITLFCRNRVIIVNAAVQGAWQRDASHPEASHYCSEQDSLPSPSKESKIAK